MGPERVQVGALPPGFQHPVAARGEQLVPGIRVPVSLPARAAGGEHVACGPPAPPIPE
ncbi:MAG TPA: hypothetical protein VK399_13815 [Longimicrobiaceae bacterium]|nr:hypothetical protein [Longimicrobiaceae bacterium]